MSDKKRIIVYHGYYGCETGCCGHYVSIIPEDAKFDEWGDPSKEDKRKWTFSHPYTSDDEWRAWAEQQIREQFGDEHVADLDWEHSVISDD